MCVCARAHASTPEPICGTRLPDNKRTHARTHARTRARTHAHALTWRSASVLALSRARLRGCVRTRVRMYLLCVCVRVSACVHVVCACERVRACCVCVCRDLGHDEVIIADKEEPGGGGVPEVEIEQREEKLGQGGPVVGRQYLPRPPRAFVRVHQRRDARTHAKALTHARVPRTGTSKHARTRARATHTSFRNTHTILQHTPHLAKHTSSRKYAHSEPAHRSSSAT